MVTKHWHRLPTEVGKHPFLEIFKSCPDITLSNTLWVTLMSRAVGLGSAQSSLPTSAIPSHAPLALALAPQCPPAHRAGLPTTPGSPTPDTTDPKVEPKLLPLRDEGHQAEGTGRARQAPRAPASRERKY